MAMQYDVKSTHLSASGVVVSYRTRIKGAIVSANASAATRNTVFADNLTQTGTYGRSTTTVTVTIANHGLATGDRVWLGFAAGTGGTATTNVYVGNGDGNQHVHGDGHVLLGPSRAALR
jgi:hypothetical protein